MINLFKMGTNPKRLLIVIIACAVLFRVAASVYLGNEVVDLPGTFDQLSYHKLALRVLDGQGFSFGEQWWPATRANEPTAHWSFLYTLFLVVVYAISNSSPLFARLLQSFLVGILIPWLVYRISLRLFAGSAARDSKLTLAKGEKVGLLAAAITAVYIYFIYYAASLMTESFYIISILWSFDIGLQITQTGGRKLSLWLLLGLALGIAVLLRQVFLLFIPFFLIWLWWVARPKLSYLLLPILLIMLMILPWIIRNYLAFEQFVLLNTNSGYAFFWGNHPIHGTEFIPILPDDGPSYYSLIPANLLHLNEAALDSALLKLAFENIFNDPGRYLLLSLSRIPPYFVFWPSSESSFLSNVYRMASFGLFLPFMLVGLIRSFRLSFVSFQKGISSPFFLLYFFIIIYTGIHVLTWTLIRYRLPVDAVLVIFAGIAIIDVVEWFQMKRRQTLTTPL